MRIPTSMRTLSVGHRRAAALCLVATVACGRAEGAAGCSAADKSATRPPVQGTEGRRMRATASPRMERLRSLLAGPPEQPAFGEVMGIIAGYSDLPPWHNEPERDEGIAEAERALATWDDSVREVPVNSRSLIDNGTVPRWGRLVRRIDFYRDDDWGTEARILAASPYMRDLRQIKVTRSGGDILEPFARSTEVRALRVLQVSRGYISDETWKRLATAPQLASLEQLMLSDVGLRPENLARWLEGTPGRTLRELDLRNEPWAGDTLLRVLLPRTRLLGQLTSLSAYACFLRDEHAEALARASALRGLRTLDLRKNDITAKGRKAILDAPQFSSTHVLFD